MLFLVSCALKIPSCDANAVKDVTTAVQHVETFIILIILAYVKRAWKMYPDVLPSYVRTELIREGIINSGNTCFLAASLQCLYSVTPLRRLLISDNYKRYLAPEASLKIEND